MPDPESKNGHRPAAGQRQLHEPRRIAATEIDREVLDRDARRVVLRLQHQGHEAYFVGGCVRDLLIGRVPKDFDVATSAHPHAIKRLFRNGRIIGRRFRLVHVYYGDNIVETATFRADPTSDDGPSDDLLIVEDNEFGSAEEDARRRDFTVNALFLDPATHTIIDYVDGLRDLDARVLRTIGDPQVRMAEDPVRIMRAIKFATRLGFHIEDDTWDAICDAAPELARSAPPRVTEEILRLMRSGTALGAFQKLRHCGALEVILPELDEHLGPRDSDDPKDRKRQSAFVALLEALDGYVHDGFEPSTAICIAILYHDIAERQANEETRTLPGEPSDLHDVTGEVIERITTKARLSRRDSGRARRIIYQQSRFLGPFGRRFRPSLFCLSEEFPESLDLFRLRCEAKGEGWDIYKSWVERYQAAQDLGDDEVEKERKRARRGRRRRRKR